MEHSDVVRSVEAIEPDWLSQARVLVVDDVAANITLLRRILSAAGVGHVDGLTDPRLVVGYCEAQSPQLVLLDLNMPDFDGYEVLAALDTALPHDSFIPVIVLTGDASAEARERALLAGAKDFLTKPFNATEVALRVRNHLETGALYARTREHSLALQRELDHQHREEQRLERLRRARVTRLRHVLATGALSMVFQPIVDLTTGHMVGVEALARFAHTPHRPPNEWFAEAESVDMGSELELAAIHLALDSLSLLPDDTFLSVNVSPDVVAGSALRSVLASFPGGRIVLELTEHARINDYDALSPSLDELRAQGIRIAVDDAGSGYSGLQHILRLRPDILKLDHDLTRSIETDHARHALSTSLAHFARELDAVLVAEGIETDAQLAVLRDIHVPWGQGYHLGRPGTLPLPVEDFRFQPSRSS
jgi:EAL domain-containing protein (putative c-di-GMP-specific phosphodiesterase class I)/FixJ family two-component response regulator